MFSARSRVCFAARGLPLVEAREPELGAGAALEEAQREMVVEHRRRHRVTVVRAGVGLAEYVHVRLPLRELPRGAVEPVRDVAEALADEIGRAHV